MVELFIICCIIVALFGADTCGEVISWALSLILFPIAAFIVLMIISGVLSI